MISNVHASNGVAYGGLDGAPGTAMLTPDTLLAYCSSRLQALDTSIKRYFAEQQQQTKAMSDATKLISILTEGTWKSFQVGGDVIKGDPGHQANHANKANEILKLWRETESPDVKAACALAFRRVGGCDIHDFSGKGALVDPSDVAKAADKIKPVDADQIEKEIANIKETQSDLSKAAELNMIQLQSLVSQRQLAVQLTTQLMQTLNESSKQIVGNIR